MKTKQERKNILTNIRTMVEHGLSTHAAIQKSGISTATYYAWNRKPKRIAQKPAKLIQTPKTIERLSTLKIGDGVVFFRGSSKDLENLARITIA